MKRPFILSAVAALLALLPYTLGWRHAFVYDDHGVIEDNAFLAASNAWSRTLTFDTMLDAAVPDGGRPLVILTYLVDRALWGLRPAGFRVTNWTLHALAVVLLYMLVRRISANAYAAFAAAMLFGLHPTLLEAVHAPAFREDLLATAGLIAALLAARCGLEAALVFFVAALASKESGVVAVPLLLWYWLCFPNQRPARPHGPIIIGVGLVLTLAFIGVWWKAGTFQTLSRASNETPLPFPTNLWTAPALFLRLLRFLVWPHPLRPDHVIAPVAAPTDPRFLLGAIAVLAFAAAALLLRSRHPMPAFALGWLLIMFLPVSNIIPLHNPFAERYAYTPCAGFAIIVADMLSRLAPARARRLALALLSVIYAFAITRTIRAWQDDFSLWQRTLAYEPRSARAWVWTGLELKRRGLRVEARRHFERAAQLKPGDAAALVNLGVMLGEEGQLAESEQFLRRAIERRPDKAEAWWNLAVCLHLQGRIEEAEQAARDALAASPYFAPARRAFESSGGFATPMPASHP